MTSTIAIRIAEMLPAVPPVPVADVVEATSHWWAGFILWLPLISLVLCGLCAAFKVRSKLPAWITVASLACSFFLTVLLATGDQVPVWVLVAGGVDVRGDDRGPLAREPECARPADPAAGPGDHRHLVLQSHVRSVRSSGCVPSR